MPTQNECSCCKARWIEFETTAAFTEEDDSFSASVTYWHDGEDPDPDEAGLTINNTSHIFSAEEGAAGIALYDPDDDEYYAIQLSCPGSGT